MPSLGDYRAEIAIDDRATGALREIGDAMRSLQGETDILRQAFASIDRNSSFSGIAAAGGEVVSSFRALSAQVVGMVGPVAALATGFGTWGMVNIAVDASRAAAAMRDFAGSLGAATAGERGNVLALTDAIRRLGVPVERAAAGFAGMQRVLFEAAHGGNDRAADLYRRLGINIRDANGQIRSAASLLPELSRAFEVNTNELTRQAMARDLFGEGGEAMIRVLSRLRSAGEGRSLYGYIPRPEDQANLAAAAASFEHLSTAFQGLKEAVGANLAPVLKPVFDDLADLILTNRADLVDLLTGSLRDMATALHESRPHWQGWIQDVKAAVAEARVFLESIGGLKTAMIALGAVAMSPLITATWNFTAAVGGLAIAIGTSPAGGLLLSLTLLAGALKSVHEAYKLVQEIWAGETVFQGPLSGLSPQQAAEARRAGDAYLRQERDAGRTPNVREWLRRERRLPNPEAGFPFQPRNRSGGQEGSGGASPAPGGWTWPALPEFLQPRSRSGGQEGPRENAPAPGTGTWPSLRGLLHLQSFNPAAVSRGPSPFTAADLAGRVRVEVVFTNAPPGMRPTVRVEGGILAPPEVEVGYGLQPRSI